MTILSPLFPWSFSLSVVRFMARSYKNKGAANCSPDRKSTSNAKEGSSGEGAPNK